jgi:FkbM family methyltransferase
MKLNTSILFQLLLRVLRPAIVCDVGSLDGAQALRFRRLCPRARVLALEANPANAAALVQDARLQQQRIELVPKAAWNRDGAVTFHVEHGAAVPGQRWRSGISSTRARLLGSLGAQRIEVPAVRLDSLLAPCSKSDRIALWIDTEGASYEVLEGARALAPQIVLVHAEVETRELWGGQRLGGDVEQLMGELGFREIARGLTELQHDRVWVPGRRAAAVRLATVAARLCALGWTHAERASGGRLGVLARRWLR